MHPRFIVAPLNWGLGHASRCIPVIRALLCRGAEVVIASDGAALDFLCREFPGLKSHTLPPYGIRYPRRSAMAFRMLVSSPRLFSAVKKEREAMKSIVAEEKPDAIISDNRYGCHHDTCYSVILTHQVNIQCPPHLRWTQQAINRINRRFLDRFNALWIPDFPLEPSLAGALSHPAPEGAIYTGPLSRFEKEIPTSGEPCDVLVICSGPEPQRTLFERKLKKELAATVLQAVLVRGVVGRYNEPVVQGNITVYDWLPSDKMCAVMNAARYIVSRPGYSTVMDLARLGKIAVFVPTPGQTEQEYLAGHFLNRGIFYCETQYSFDLSRALAESDRYTGLDVQFGPQALDRAIDSLPGW